MALIISFLLLLLTPLPVRADLSLPAVQRLHLSAPFNPAVLKGVRLDPNDPFHFEFFLDQGQQTSAESDRLIKYFLAALTIPEKDLWVNLSPYEKDRIVPQAFGQTEMGRDLLAQDYVLKQITASLIYPEDETGKKFWAKVYEQARDRDGHAEVPINTFNKVWIVPDKAVVYENGGTAFVVESHLKVMLEEDYLAKNGDKNGDRHYFSKEGAAQIAREAIVPTLEKEVNEGKNFAQLRQVFHSLILATWYKQKIRNSLLNAVYSDQKKIAGVHVSSDEKESIYKAYVESFKRGAFNYIREEASPSGKRVPRKYFSGGIEGFSISRAMVTIGPKQLSSKQVSALNKNMVVIDGGIQFNTANIGSQAMSAQDRLEIERLWNETNKLHLRPFLRFLTAQKNLFGHFFGAFPATLNNMFYEVKIGEIAPSELVPWLDNMVKALHVFSKPEGFREFGPNEGKTPEQWAKFFRQAYGKMPPAEQALLYHAQFELAQFITAYAYDPEIAEQSLKVEKQFLPYYKKLRQLLMKPVSASAITMEQKAKITAYMLTKEEHMESDLLKFASDMGLSEKQFFNALSQLNDEKAFKTPDGKYSFTSYMYVYDDQGQRTNRIKSFVAIRRDGDRYKCVVLVVFNSRGEIYLQVRKGKFDGGVLETTSAGADTNFGTMKAIIQETQSETGRVVVGKMVREIINHDHPHGKFLFNFSKTQVRQFIDKVTGIFFGHQQPTEDDRKEVYSINFEQLNEDNEKRWMEHIEQEAAQKGSSHFLWTLSEFRTKKDQIRAGVGLNEEVSGFVKTTVDEVLEYFDADPNDSENILSHGFRGELHFPAFRKALLKQANEAMVLANDLPAGRDSLQDYEKAKRAFSAWFKSLPRGKKDKPLRIVFGFTPNKKVAWKGSVWGDADAHHENLAKSIGFPTVRGSYPNTGVVIDYYPSGQVKRIIVKNGGVPRVYREASQFYGLDKRVFYQEDRLYRAGGHLDDFFGRQQKFFFSQISETARFLAESVPELTDVQMVVFHKLSEYEIYPQLTSFLTKGGVDFNPAQMSMDVKTEGQEFRFNGDWIDIDPADISGAYFTVRTTQPVDGISAILSLP
jgi:hypothetical protein